jgi:hypothetical protein
MEVAQMTATRLSAAVTQISLPADARALSTLPRIDYEDAFIVEGAGERTPREWARAAIDDAPARVRARLYTGWLSLGLRLGPPWSSHRVLGWRVARSESDWLLLSARSWLGLRGELLFRSEADGLLFATMIQLTNPIARSVWARVTDTHQQVVRSLLTHAADREVRHLAARR